MGTESQEQAPTSGKSNPDAFLRKGKSDSFVARGGTSGKHHAPDTGITRKRSGLFSTGDNQQDDFEEAFISRASSASHQGLSFSIAGPVQVPQGDFGLISDLAEARRYAAIYLEKGSRKEEDHHVAIRMHKHAASAPLPISLKFTDVKYKIVLEKRPCIFKKPQGRGGVLEKEILHGVTGYVLPGEVLALMGPSGSGKTTLINILSGRMQQNVQGTITYNDSSYTKSLKRRLGFVMQDDVLYSHLTVKETLTYAALLRLPKSLSTEQKIERAEEVIHELGLERCQDTIIGGPFLRGISGGERKRVCVGHEILIDPSLLFLDEPTSGLDSTTALRIVQLLHEISKGGRTVITTIHQPSSRLFHMFDKLILLAEGNSIYFGKAGDAMEYFSSIGFSPLIAMNPADFLLDIANGNTNDVSIPAALEHKFPVSEAIGDGPIAETPAEDVKQYLVQMYDTVRAPAEKQRMLELGSIENDLKDEVSVKRQWSASWWQQFSVLLMRGFKERRHEYLSWLRLVQVIACSLIVGCLWWRSKLETEREVQDQVGLIFFMAIFWGFFPLFTAIFTFPQERAILAKERASNMYRLSAYFLARTLGDLPLDLTLPVMFLLIMYFMTNLQMTVAAFFLTMLTIFLNVVTAQGLGVAIGAAMMDVKKATTLASVLLLTFMLSGGFYVEDIPSFFAWIRYLSFYSYAYKLLLKVQYDGNQKYDCTNARCKTLGTSPAFRGISLEGGGQEAWALLVMAVLYRLLAYFALRKMRLRI